MHKSALIQQIEQLWINEVLCTHNPVSSAYEIQCTRSTLAEICGKLCLKWDFSFAGLVVEEGDREWLLRYCFYGERAEGWIHVIFSTPLDLPSVPSIVEFVHAADWHEREAEDLFGLIFEGHPQLGNFVLHDDVWQEAVAPMRRAFNLQNAAQQLALNRDLRPSQIVQEPGSFVLPIGPKYSGVAESAHFLLETVGEDVIRAEPRLFYKWRAIEKMAEGQSADNVLLLAERFAATTAFAHGWAFCQAVESINGTQISQRAQLLRVFLAELERLRHHVGAIEGICESTALGVANSQAAILEEDLLRICGELTGHRYLFGLLMPGGLLCDLPDTACQRALVQSQQVIEKLHALEQQLRASSSFLDRLEEVGVIEGLAALEYGLLGPVARGSGLARDMRQMQPYAEYQNFNFEVPCEQEGDGYARLRVLFAEAKQAVCLMEQALEALPQGRICTPSQNREGAALGWVEAPRGAAFHWVRLSGDGRVLRYRCIPPSFANWHGFHLAVEKFAFQDFPIILSSFALSVAENDR